ncbi:uncharacterized protein SAPINGB_P001112 [Magnusiomyces paraingens]|uniref:HTH CENPB-type domain-containing protein n=1 Tax=Magnusiomyces paraingens TaxID=2606893 RepID=A0A5E8B4M3_9ASCO|nr:uncharacterized protein SAPINGB_P001112 [Saprochaete ingens]VVT46233.1 unnamed protein product [Saprochaete ingens]
MSTLKEQKILKAVEAFSSPTNTHTLVEISKSFDVPYSTVRDRLHGIRPLATAQAENQLLMPIQESILVDHIINLCQLKSNPTSKSVMEMAGKILHLENPEKPQPSRSWLNGFIERSGVLVRSKRGIIDVPNVREGGEHLIQLFFDRLHHYETKYDVPPSRVWNLDECVFKCDESVKGSLEVKPKDVSNSASYESSNDLVTVLECISADARILEPIFIYKELHTIEAWFPDISRPQTMVSVSKTDFINSEIFLEWFDKYFPSSKPGTWQVLILDGCEANELTKFHRYAMRKGVVLLYLPADMSNVLQQLDRSCFNTDKQGFRRQTAIDFPEGLSPSKRTNFLSYMRKRNMAYSRNVITEGWKLSGIYPRSVTTAINFFRRQRNLPILENTSELPSKVQNSEVNTNQSSTNPAPSPVHSAPSETPIFVNWRAERMYMMRHPKECLKALKRSREDLALLTTQLAQVQQELAITNNKIRDLQKDESRKRPRVELDKAP